LSAFGRFNSLQDTHLSMGFSKYNRNKGLLTEEVEGNLLEP